jgi:cytochrome c oxidase assembly protein subunit 15
MIVNIDPFKRFIEIWLYAMLLLIILIIFVGGLTRLTDSGLSITEWELFKGIFPPLNNKMWIYYFDLYKEIPEYSEINFTMSLSEFKVIYYWEYAHRLLARLIGLISFLPLIYLSFKFNNLKKKIYKYYIIFLLICFQGFIGWFMVKSGLVDNTDVSHYRLASHLSVALIILSFTFWFILENLKISKFKIKINSKFLTFFLIIILVQIILGAFLAGLNGGLLYNSWPDMNGNFLADDIDQSDLYNLNFFDNPSVIQFYHRLAAYIIIIFLVFFNYIFYKQKIKSNSIIVFNLAILLQIVIGILTLLTGVKIYYASLHQLGSVFVLTSFIFIYFKNTN